MIRNFFSVLILLIIVVTIILGSLKRHKFTRRFCNGLYVEAFEVNLEGKYSEYLTDSVNFRLRIGNYDIENQDFNYQCNGDSIYIEKVEFEEDSVSHNTKGSTWVIEKKTVDLKALVKEHEFE